MSNNNIGVRYSDEELLEFKTLINTKLDKARSEVSFIKEQMSEANENGANQQGGDWTDESSSHTEMELLNSMLARQQLFIQNLNNALLRIQNKTYGVCSITGQLIDKKRLLLVPHATKSMEAKTKIANKPDRGSDHFDKLGGNGTRSWADEESTEAEDAAPQTPSFD